MSLILESSVFMPKCNPANSAWIAQSVSALFQSRNMTWKDKRTWSWLIGLSFSQTSWRLLFVKLAMSSYCLVIKLTGGNFGPICWRSSPLCSVTRTCLSPSFCTEMSAQFLGNLACAFIGSLWHPRTKLMLWCRAIWLQSFHRRSTI